MRLPQSLVPGLDPGIHVSAGKRIDPENKTWMAGSSPARTSHGMYQQAADA
jgi:hypothetical protein